MDESAEQKVQIILAYENEPYLAFDATMDAIVASFQCETMPVADEDYRPWLRGLHTHLRAELILIPDRPRDIMEDETRRTRFFQEAILILGVSAIMQGLQLDKFKSVMLCYYAVPAKSDGQAPGHQIAFSNKVIPLERIAEMTTARCYTFHSADHSFTEMIPKSHLTKTGSRLSMGGQHCVCISGYWNNQGDDGLSLSIESAVPGELDRMLEVLDTMILAVAEARPSKESLISLLTEKAKEQTGDDVEKMYILASIAYMEESGMLESDEYNGMMYMFVDGNEVTIDRKDA